MFGLNLLNIAKKHSKLKILLIILVSAVVLYTSTGCTGADHQSSSAPGLSDVEYHITVDDYQITSMSARLWKTREDLDFVTIQTIVEVKNTDSRPIEIAEASYDVYLDDGELVESHEYVDCYPEILLPGETGYIYDKTLYGGDLDDQIYIAPKIVAYRAYGDMRITVKDADFTSNADGDLRIIGHITNPYDDDQTFVCVVAYLYNSEDKCVGLLRDTLQDVRAGQTVSFDLCDSGLQDHVDIRSCKVISYVWQLDIED